MCVRCACPVSRRLFGSAPFLRPFSPSVSIWWSPTDDDDDDVDARARQSDRSAKRQRPIRVRPATSRRYSTATGSRRHVVPVVAQGVAEPQDQPGPGTRTLRKDPGERDRPPPVGPRANSPIPRER